MTAIQDDASRPRRLTALNEMADALRAAGRNSWVFSLRTLAAAMLAYTIAHLLNLEKPVWAMMTVYIVSQPIAGMVLAKGFYRLVGTVIGALASIALVLALGDYPWLFIVALSLWIGLCTYVASSLRNPEAYGAALSGYTATIIGLPALAEPHLAIELAQYRCLEIMLGIVCAGLLSRLVLPQLAGKAMAARLKSCIYDLAAYVGKSFANAPQQEQDAIYHKLIADAQALSDMRTYARLEAPSQATRAHSVRRSIGNLLWALSTIRLAHRHLTPDNAVLHPIRRELYDNLAQLAVNPKALDQDDAWASRFKDIGAHISSAHDHIDETRNRAQTLSSLTMAGELAQAFHEMLRGYEALIRPKSQKQTTAARPTLLIHRDFQLSMRNALRAMVATFLFSAFWILTGWVELSGVVVLVAVATSLFAALPDPMRAVIGFLKGTAIALPIAFVIGQLIMPHFSTYFWQMFLLIGPIMLVCGLLMADSRFTGRATPFAINFLVFLNPQFPMPWEPGFFLAAGAAVISGIVMAMGVYRLVLPNDPMRRINDISAAMRQTLARLCLQPRTPRRSAFESLAYDRINEMMTLSRLTDDDKRPLFAGAISSVTVGLEILRLRGLQQGADAIQAKHIDAYLHQIAATLDGDAILSAPSDTPTDDRALSHDELRVAASRRIINLAISDNPAFFGPQQRAQLAG